MRQPEAKRHHNFTKYTSAASYRVIVPARVLLNGGMLVGNKLMYRSTGGIHCYLSPPLSGILNSTSVVV